MFPVEKLQLLIDWLRGANNPGTKALLLAVHALMGWAIGLMPDAPPVRTLSDDKEELAAALESLHSVGAQGFVPPAWLLPLLLKVLELILSRGK